MTNSERSALTNRDQAWFLETISGPWAGQKSHLRPRQVVYFGRRSDLDSLHSYDGHMSALHFSAEFDGAACKIKDLNSRNGTFVNGTRIQEAVLARNDLIMAGETTLMLATDQPSNAGSEGRLLSFLRHNFQPLFAILDAARDRYALALLLQSQVQYQSLYEGRDGEMLSDVAPYLVQLPTDSDLLRKLVQEGWGKSWGVYLKCAAEFQELRRHLRHFLEVRQPDGEQLYFRFYDPRVLRVYLPNLHSDEASTFLGPIHCYLMEDKEPDTLLQFLNTGQGVAKAAVPLTEAAQPAERSSPRLSEASATG
jgi:hypothetical protein